VIAELREQLGWSQRELAEQAGIGKETVWKIENNQTRPSTRTLEKLAKALRIEVSEFYKYEAASFAERAYETDPLVTRFKILLESIPKSQRRRFVEGLEELVKALLVDL